MQKYDYGTRYLVKDADDRIKELEEAFAALNQTNLKNQARVAELEEALAAERLANGDTDLEDQLVLMRDRIAEFKSGWKHYALCHDRYGADDPKTGRAWDEMRKLVGDDL